MTPQAAGTPSRQTPSAASLPLASNAALYAPRLPPAPRRILGVVVPTGFEAADRVAGKAGEDLERGAHLQLRKMGEEVARA